MNLYVWSPFGILESIDPECLTVITYVKIAKAPVNILTNVKPWFCPNYTLPLLKHSRNDSVGLKFIIPYFRKENYGVEYNLSDEDLAKLNILTMNIHQDLIPAVDYLMWFHKSNYYRVTRNMFGDAIGFPMSLFWLNIMKNKATKKVLSSRLSFQSLSKVKLSDDIIQETLYNTAKRCLTSLEYILNEKQYFISNNPTYVDALVYGYLWPIINLDYESDALINYIRQCTKIIEMLHKIHNTYYEHRVIPVSSARSNPNTEYGNSLIGKTCGFITDNWVQIRNSSIFILLVSTMMICYAKSSRRVN